VYTDLWFGNSHGFLKPAVQKAPLQVPPSFALQLQVELLHTSKLESYLCLLSAVFVDQAIGRVGAAGDTDVRLFKSLLYQVSLQRDKWREKIFSLSAPQQSVQHSQDLVIRPNVLLLQDHEAALSAGQQDLAITVLLGQLHSIQRRHKEVYLGGTTMLTPVKRSWLACSRHFWTVLPGKSSWQVAGVVDQ